MYTNKELGSEHLTLLINIVKSKWCSYKKGHQMCSHNRPQKIINREMGRNFKILSWKYPFRYDQWLISMKVFKISRQP